MSVLCADIAGDSRLVGLDELGTFHRVKALRSGILEPLIAERAGRVIDYAGDGALVVFDRVVDAVECALEIQRRLAEHEPEVSVERRLTRRLGLHVGEVIVDGPSVYGDSVNIAARLEELSEPGGLCLSDTAYRGVADRVAIEADYGGEPPLKNIAHGVGTWFWPNGARGGRSPSPLPPPDKTSIAVLPFDDFGFGGDDGLADGVAEDLTTALARQSWLFVVARTSAFALRGCGIDAREAGRRFGVRYLVEGSVRRAGERVSYFEAKAVLLGIEPDADAGRRRALDRVEQALRADPEEPMALGAPVELHGRGADVPWRAR